MKNKGNIPVYIMTTISIMISSVMGYFAVNTMDELKKNTSDIQNIDIRTNTLEVNYGFIQKGQDEIKDNQKEMNIKLDKLLNK
jgi:heme/copper-type cytochrome/quinol oxidase subunit 2